MLSDLSFPDGYFDVVHASQVFEHLPNPKSDLAQIHRILRRGGLLYIDVPNYAALSILLGQDDFILNSPPQHINYFTPRTLMRLLESQEFSIVQLTTGGGLKWENLLGRKIRSDILNAYGMGDGKAHKDPSLLGGLVSGAKKALKFTIVGPILYRRLKVGMGLIAIARRE
jgi:SAM-dependent methyltransferase